MNFPVQDGHEPISPLVRGEVMKMPENAMHFLEEHIPELAHAAVKQAYWQALASGSTVLEVENGTLVEVSPDGSRTRIKEMPPHTTVRPGQRIEIP